ncbi:hypothetical protein [Streptomyces sp. NPDC002994]|uniref:hypothetical protein n=1 Tax=Streptomyces sp. NPDC002994 TaxID=3154441 RepID=UPI0033A5477B
MNTTAAARDLRTIISTWPNLADALDTRGGAHWPPAGRMADYLNDLDLLDVPQRGARDGSGTGESPAPLRIEILDTQRTVHAALVEVADHTAAAVQRSPMSFAPSSWPPADQARRNQLANADVADPRRWRYRGTRPGAQYTALWLLARVERRPGPFERLAEHHERHIANVATESVSRIDRALQLTRLTRPLTETCACGGVLTIGGGDGHPPAISCTRCGRTISAQLVA